jgi:hypothetical protein
VLMYTRSQDWKLLACTPGSILIVKKISEILPRISSTLPMRRLFSR